MDTRYIHRARLRSRGAVRPAVLAIIAVIVVLVAAAWFLIIKPHDELIDSEAGGHPSTPVAAAEQAQQPTVNVSAMNFNQLLGLARKAVNEGRLVSPAGNNAFELYLHVLEKQPGNQVASDALRETFPVGANVAEQAINQRDFTEAQREIDLLAKADPANYTLTILRSKLDAQRKVQDHEQQQAADKERQAQLAAAQKASATEKVADAADAKPASTRAAQPQAPVAAPVQHVLQPVPQVAAPTEEASTVSATHEAVLVKNVNPRYPVDAMRAGREGWVDLTFTITASGDVDNVKVVDSEPRHVFDRAAIDAVEHWKYEPATQNGTPVPAQDHKRVVFKLN